jgi:hypothetical protein
MKLRYSRSDSLDLLGKTVLMHMLGHRRIALLSFMLAFAIPAMAQGQGWLADRDTAEGRGFQFGRIEIHPGIGLEAGYDSNVFYSAQGTSGAAMLRVTPHIAISTLGSERRTSDEEGDDEDREGSPPGVNFRAGLSASYLQYYLGSASDQSNVSANADIALTIAPERPFSVDITNVLSRSIQPFTDPGPDINYGRDQNTAGVRFNLQSRGGIFRGSVGYRMRLDYFEDSSFRYANNLNHDGSLELVWRFRPQTSLIYDASVQFNNYGNSAGAPTTLSDGVFVRSRFGLNGAFTRTFSLLAMVSYEAGFFAAGDNFDSVGAELEGRFRFSDQLQFALGFQRSFSPSTLGNFFGRNRGYLKLDMLFGGRFILTFDAGVAHMQYGAITGGGVSTSNRTDVVFDASIFGEYRFTDWLAMTTTIGYSGRTTDFQFTLPDLVDPAENYNKIEAWLGVRVFY